MDIFHSSSLNKISMKTIFALFSFFFFLFSINAQQVQWASKVIKFSSDLGGKQNGIKRILGKPDVFPQAGASANAWVPKNALDGYERVEVGFETPQTVKQVAIFENLNAKLNSTRTATTPETGLSKIACSIPGFNTSGAS